MSLGRVEVSIAFQSDKSPEAYVELARLAERGGFDVVSVYHDLLFQPATTFCFGTQGSGSPHHLTHLPSQCVLPQHE